MYQILNNKFHVCIANSTSGKFKESFLTSCKGRKFFQSHPTYWNVSIEEKLIFDGIWKEVGKEDYILQQIINLLSRCNGVSGLHLKILALMHCEKKLPCQSYNRRGSGLAADFANLTDVKKTSSIIHMICWKSNQEFRNSNKIGYNTCLHKETDRLKCFSKYIIGLLFFLLIFAFIVYCIGKVSL